MRIGSIDGRLALVSGGLALDVARASDGLFAADPDLVFDRWAEFRAWAAGKSAEDGQPFTSAQVGPPLRRPTQVFAIGLNYRAHVAEAGIQQAPSSPAVFTKFATSITGPYDTVALPSTSVDWEVELVAVIGGPVPQFSLGKSFPGFSPIGPVIVTPDEFSDPDDLGLSCALDGEVLQDGRTKDLIFSVPALVAQLSAVLPLLPGDIIFTGTPSGVGMGRDPKRYLPPGGTLVSTIEGIGELRTPLVAGPGYRA
jgi:2-keto-4-pentenoate hydratase/2-oxohepta-3-ene-1,7-dioic acid hydratase in catechol pathway